MPNTTRTADGAAVRRTRIALGLQAKEVADLVGISTSGFRNIENGHKKPRTVVILAIARALGVHPDRISTVIVNDEARSA